MRSGSQLVIPSYKKNVCVAGGEQLKGAPEDRLVVAGVSSNDDRVAVVVIRGAVLLQPAAARTLRHPASKEKLLPGAGAASHHSMFFM